MKLAVLALLLGACVADDTTAPPIDLDVEGAVEVTEDNDEARQICALAAELPAENVCSLVCDPDAFKARLADDGMKTGNCYQVRCNLSPEVSVTVGVCLPP